MGPERTAWVKQVNEMCLKAEGLIMELQKIIEEVPDDAIVQVNAQWLRAFSHAYLQALHLIHAIAE